MLDAIDALVALESFGTVSEAATRLRITQSAVSKRLQALQDQLGFRLLEREGRRVRLSAQAIEFLARARPLVAELRDLAAHPGSAPETRRFSIALADSIASSWGPAVIRDAVAAVPRAAVELHVHRSVLVLESVRLGRYDAGVCTESDGVRDLVQHRLIDEPLVIVHAELAARATRGLPTVTIEPSSATWRAISPTLRAHHPALIAGPMITVESFAAAAQMARAGFGNALVPLGLARDLGLPPRALRLLAGVTRRVALVTRKTVHELPAFMSLRHAMALAAQEQVTSWLPLR
jgi:DNA-binding transcriptional LysR family regulator